MVAVEGNRLSFERRMILQGYYNMFRDAKGNGGCNHKHKQFQTVLKIRLEMGMDISQEYENQIKQVIRRLYND